MECRRGFLIPVRLCPSPYSDLQKYLQDHLAKFESDQVAFSMWMSTNDANMISFS
jgi:hypothetical protein